MVCFIYMTKEMNFTQLSAAWASFTAGSVLVTLLANLFFPRAVVLGNHLLSPLMGAFYAMTVVSLIAVGLMPVVEYIVKENKLKLTSTHWLVLYWVVNAASLWLMSRFAELVGLGLSSWAVAVALGFVIDLVQGGLMMHVVSKVRSD